MDFANLTFIGLATLGFVNVLSFFKPDMKSEIKFGLSVVAAFLFTFVPADLGNVIFEKAKLALETAFAASGTYKLVTKAGGN
jgi:hypothetical protein